MWCGFNELIYFLIEFFLCLVRVSHSWGIGTDDVVVCHFQVRSHESITDSLGILSKSLINLVLMAKPTSAYMFSFSERPLQKIV